MSYIIGVLLTLLSTTITYEAPYTIRMVKVQAEEPEPPDPVLCSCVKYLRERMGVPIKGDAEDIIPNKTFADSQKGDLILFNYSGIYHVALILEKKGEWLTITESNKEKCEQTTRTISITDTNIVGFYEIL